MGVMDSGLDAAHRPGMTEGNVLLGVDGQRCICFVHAVGRIKFVAATSVSSPQTRGPIRRVACVERRWSMTLAQTTSCGYGSRIALRLCGTTAVSLLGLSE